MFYLLTYKWKLFGAGSAVEQRRSSTAAVTEIAAKEITTSEGSYEAPTLQATYRAAGSRTRFVYNSRGKLTAAFDIERVGRH